MVLVAKGLGVFLKRPEDYYAEMFKADVVMQRVKHNLVKQQVKIQNFEEKKARIENKKFHKLVSLQFYSYKMLMRIVERQESKK